MKLNPFKNRNAEIEKEFEQACEESREKIKSSIKAAEAMTGAAEKVLALRDVQRGIDGAVSYYKDSIDKEAGKKAMRTFKGTTAAGIVSGVALIFVVHPFLIPLALPLMYGGVAGGCIAGIRREKNITKKLKQRYADHLAYLDEERGVLSQKIEAFVAAHVPEIAKSPLCPKVMEDRILAKAFSTAAAKHVIKAEEEAVALKKAQEAQKAQERLKGKKPVLAQSYKKIIDVMKPAEEKETPAVKKPGLG